MKKNKNAFTLIELLAVIVILAVILVIAIPRILNVIEESKKDSIKSSARMIINSAEKKNMIDKVNGSTEEVTCDNSVKLSKEDYESCKITIDEEGKATINLVGKGKFDGYKCIGTNDNLACGQVESITLPLNGKEYIEKLYNNELSRIENGLKKDNTEDQNIRYYGSNPNNYVRFNNELWRIIGIFGNNVKLIRNDRLGWLSWDTSESTVNSGYGINQWGESKDTSGNIYEGADLQVYLNKMYYGGIEVTCYNDLNNTKTTCPKDSNGNFLELDDVAKNLIDNHTWNIGAMRYISRTNTLTFYQAERGSVHGKSSCSSGNQCNDTIIRTTEWTGYVGLPYVTDWAYASSEGICETNMATQDSSNNYICKNNNWMQKSILAWYLLPVTTSSGACYAWYVNKTGDPAGNYTYGLGGVIPAVYLKSDVFVTGGLGTSDNPYKLWLSEN